MLFTWEYYKYSNSGQGSQDYTEIADLFSHRVIKDIISCQEGAEGASKDRAVPWWHSLLYTPSLCLHIYISCSAYFISISNEWKNWGSSMVSNTLRTTSSNDNIWAWIPVCLCSIPFLIWWISQERSTITQVGDFIRTYTWSALICLSVGRWKEHEEHEVRSEMH